MTPPGPPTRADPVLLYDGACGLCAASVRFILRHETRRALLFAPLKGTFGAGVLARRPQLATVDSMVWLDPADPSRGLPEQISIRAAAALRVARYLGRWWRFFLIGYLVPRPARDAMYAWVARHRHHLGLGKGEGDGNRCEIPAEELRERFLA